MSRDSSVGDMASGKRASRTDSGRPRKQRPGVAHEESFNTRYRRKLDEQRDGGGSFAAGIGQMAARQRRQEAQ